MRFSETILLSLIVTFLSSQVETKAQNNPVQIDLNNSWQFRQADSGQYLPATVPGCVHTDLLANNIIEDPFFGTNEKKLQWIDKKDWEYVKEFNLAKDVLEKQSIELVFDGLDTYAEVWLNGQLVLKADNMFRQWRVDCRKWLKENNTLKIRFLSPIRIGLEKLEANGYALPNDNDDSKTGGLGTTKVSVFTRKAQYQYGWDWGPRFVTSGIWRPVYIQAWNKARIVDVRIENKSITEKIANLSAGFEIEANANEKTTVSININGIRSSEKEVQLVKGTNQVNLDFVVENPKLWWLNGLGEPYRYKVTASVETQNSTDCKEISYGIRTIKLIQEPDSAGKSFYFELNGIPVFAKGANYIPSDAFVTNTNPEKYEQLIGDAAKANMNMLRVWGGGFYEIDIFYDLCDKYGIMVWQDFMYACSLYPGDDAFMENARQEAIYNVKRLRNHACIALWCGNNECQAAWKDWGFDKKFAAKDPKLAEKVWGDYCNLFHRVLYNVVKEYQPEAAYWASSPMASWTPGMDDDRVAQKTDKSGDRHYWDVWHGKQPFSKYVELIPRFMSEYGFQSFPEFKTVKTFAPDPADWSIESAIMMHHQKNGRGNMLIRKYMEDWYQVPANFEHFLYVSQLLQAEGIKTGMEAHRRNMPYCMGSLYWQLNDCWPVASWSGIDYNLRWKALHFCAKKAFSPQLVSPVIENEKVKVYVVSDDLKSLDAILTMKVVTFEGKVLWTSKKDIQIKANSSLAYFEVPQTEIMKDSDKPGSVFTAELVGNGKVLSQNNLYFLPFKDLKLPEPKVSFTADRTVEGYNLLLRTSKLAKNIFIDIEAADCTFSDNYFDMLPGTEREIMIFSKNTIENVDGKIRILTLDKTMK